MATEEKYNDDDDDINEIGAMNGMLTAKSVPIKLNHDTSRPTDVYPWFEITVQSIDIITQKWDASVEIHCFWQDISLPTVHPGFNDVDFVLDEGDVPIKLTEIFENKLAEGVQLLEYKYFPETSTVYMQLIVQVTFVERMELERFPMDRQFLSMDFNAWVENGNWNWIMDAPTWVPKEFQRPFCVRMLSTITEYDMLSPWIDFTADKPPLSIRLRAERKPGFYFGSIILPNFLIVAAAFAAFPIDITDVADRLSVSVTLMLTAVAFRYVITEQLPKVSYLTIMDYYLLLGFVMLTFLIGENGFVGITQWEEGMRKKIDNITLYASAGIWAIVHIWWVAVLLSKSFMRQTWERMNELDQDDENDEWQWAPKEHFKGRKQSEYVIKQWEKLSKLKVSKRAQFINKEHPEIAASPR